MTLRWYVGIFLGLMAITVSSCNFSPEDSTPEPTANTPVAMVTEDALPTSLAATETQEVIATEVSPVAATNTSPPTEPVETVATELAQVPTNAFATMTAPPSFTPAPSVTETVYVPPTVTTAPQQSGIYPTATVEVQPVVTIPPMVVFTMTPPPTFTYVIAPSSTPYIVQPPTFTPVGSGAVTTPLPTSLPAARVCATCSQLRLRQSPGTTGAIVTELSAGLPVTIIGRTADNAWVEVVLVNGASGWVAAQYLEINVNLSAVSVTGAAQNAPTAIAAVLPGNINVVSGITATSRQIFLDGLSKGNKPRVFSRVGDSISASPNYLTPIGQGSYRLGEYGYLQGAINFFSGPNGRGANPFAAGSIAAKNGWSTESVLNPALAPGGTCLSGETPLECEYRLVKPSVALIMLGTNDSGGLPSAQYSANLNRIVQISIAKGVIPVLSTIPAKHFDSSTDHRVAEFNQIIIQTALTYDIPLWNYWRAMSSLPSEGLDADGVHPSPAFDGQNAVFDNQHLQYGYPMRNLTALQVLYTLWQQVLYDAETAVPATSAPGNPSSGGNPGGSTGSYSCPGAPPPRLTVGGQGRVTPGLPNKVRAEPSMAAAQVGNIPGEGVFSVLNGPYCADGYTWWQVQYEGVSGWTANGNSDEYWVEPYP